MPRGANRFASRSGDELVVAGGEDRWLRLIPADGSEPRWTLPPPAAPQRRGRGAHGGRNTLLVDRERGRVLSISPQGIPVAAKIGEDGCLRMDRLWSLKHVIAARPRSSEVLIWPRGMPPVLLDPDLPQGNRELSGVGDPPEEASFVCRPGR